MTAYLPSLRRSCVGIVMMLALPGATVVAADTSHNVTPPDAATIEKQWIAANHPYDAARKAMLAQADKVAWQGPMQPDWQSLTACFFNFPGGCKNGAW